MALKQFPLRGVLEDELGLEIRPRSRLALSKRFLAVGSSLAADLEF